MSNESKTSEVHSLKSQIQEAQKEAMRARDALRLQAVRLIWNAVRKKEIDDRKDLSDAEVQKVIMTLQKQNAESLDQAKQANRAESIHELEIEATILSSFLPKAISSEELEKIVNEVKAQLSEEGKLPQGPAAMGALMKGAMAKVGAQADGKSVQQAVKKALGL